MLSLMLSIIPLSLLLSSAASSCYTFLTTFLAPAGVLWALVTRKGKWSLSWCGLSLNLSTTASVIEFNVCPANYVFRLWKPPFLYFLCDLDCWNCFETVPKLEVKVSVVFWNVEELHVLLAAKREGVVDLLVLIYPLTLSLGVGAAYLIFSWWFFKLLS